jgi:hypothetical protein
MFAALCLLIQKYPLNFYCAETVKDKIMAIAMLLGHHLTLMYHRERILKTSTLSCNEEEEEITKPPTR